MFASAKRRPVTAVRGWLNIDSFGIGDEVAVRGPKLPHYDQLSSVPSPLHPAREAAPPTLDRSCEAASVRRGCTPSRSLRKGGLPHALALSTLMLPEMAAGLTMLPWEAGSLKKLIEENAESGFSVPIMDPWGIAITTGNNHLVDVSLVLRSVANWDGGSIAVDRGSNIRNDPGGQFNFGRVSGVGTVSASGFGDLGEPAPTFDNFSDVIVASHVAATVTLPFNNYGGRLFAATNAELRLLNANITNLSSFEGTGRVQVAGRFSGEISSDRSLHVAGASIGEMAVIRGEWTWWPVFLSGGLSGTWFNEGHATVRHANSDVRLEGGGRLVNNGTVSLDTTGAFPLLLMGNDLDPAPANRTRLVNNGLIEGSFLIAGRGVQPALLENHGTLAGAGTITAWFENHGAINPTDGAEIKITGARPSTPTIGAQFMSGTFFGGGGRVVLDGVVDTVHEFAGFVGSSGSLNLRSSGRYRGHAAILSGVAEWRSGTFEGAWVNGATLTQSTLSGLLPVNRGIADTLTNLGRIEMNREFLFRNGAVLLNHGIVSLTSPWDTNLLGTTGGEDEVLHNRGILQTDRSVTVIRDVRLENYGLLTLGGTSTLRYDNDDALVNFGTIAGTGTLDVSDGGLVNFGTIAPGLSPGRLTIRGDFTNGPDGIIDIELASATVFDVLRVSAGRARLGGTLRITLVDGFVPDAGASFAFVQYSSFSDAFAHVLVNGFSDADLNLTYTAGSLRIGITALGAPDPVPLPPSVWSLGAALALLLSARRPAKAGRARSGGRAARDPRSADD